MIFFNENDEIFDFELDNEFEQFLLKNPNVTLHNYGSFQDVNSRSFNKLTTELSQKTETLNKNTKSFCIWNIYINNILENLSLCFNENRIIHKDETIELCFENF